MNLPSVIVAATRPILVPEIVIPSRRPATERAVGPRRSARQPSAPARRWLGPARGLLVDVYA
jgi:hypothetical protein